MNDDYRTRMDRLDGRIADCERRIGQAQESARESEKQARAYDEAGGILASCSQQTEGIWQDLRQHVKGDAEWRRLEQDDEERTAMCAQARNACLEAYDDLVRQARREHEDALDIREEQKNLQRAKREYENDENRRRAPRA
ncbi:hypothetical protein OZX67_05145 [Bifidobacterium sp. ESL0728]|uniref:hypothetical protein n=1 Tax=Bifidobacterium sp. ESL0728 TaxID=2983220 RepID=UPI0023F779D9|nr:hypothetical protein [Bifidobacterium sp. ESL0728]WEV58229.1 hypothetical protein OZX67_05145 [Bifidobacterium sp. ESL0728]